MFNSLDKTVDNALLSAREAWGWTAEASGKAMGGEYSDLLDYLADSAKNLCCALQRISERLAEQVGADSLVTDPNEGSKGP